MKKVSDSKVLLILLMSLTLLSLFFVFETSAETNEEVAVSALADAEVGIGSAYQAMLKADESGADISSLLAQLNQAAGFLAHAHMAYDSGDFDEASSLAISSKNIAVEVKNTAVALGDSAFSERTQRTLLIMISSAAMATVVLVGSFWIWRIFKRHYYRRVLRMKPEFSLNEP